MSRRGRHRSGAKRGETTDNVNQEWSRLLQSFSVTAESDISPAKALEKLAELPIQSLTKPFKEVESDILLIGGHLSLVSCIGSQDDVTTSNSFGDRSDADMRCAFCRILIKLLSRSDASLTVIKFRDLIRLILEWTEQSLNATQVTQLTINSAAALGAILDAFQSQISAQMHESIRRVLTTALTKYRCSPSCSARDPAGIAPSVELCHAASDALRSLFASRQDLQPGVAETTLAAVVKFLQREKPVENPFLSRMYESLLKTLTTLISEGGGSHVAHVPSLMEIVSEFMTYGVKSLPYNVSFSESASDVSSEGSGGRYLPPHRRTSDRSGYSSASSSTFSGSETSGGSVRSADHNRASKVRLAALNLAQKMSQVHGKSMHPFWRTLLPDRQPLQRSPTAPHLVNVLLYDPHPQVRMAAAGTIAVLMEGRAQKGFLSMAELSDKQTSAIRGFMTLSHSLGRMVHSLHEGVLHAIENEEKLSVVPHLFRTLNSLIAATPYDRMPSDLRTRIARSIRKQWIKYHGQGDNDASREPACLIALRTVLGATPVDPMLSQYLEDVPPYSSDLSPLDRTIQQFRQQRESGWSLLDALLSVAQLHQDSVRSEALTALTCAATNYTEVFKERWNDVALLLERNIQQTVLEQSGPEEKAAQQAIRLFGALMADSSLKEDVCFLEHLVEAVPIHIAPSITHSSPVVRAAALAEIGGATKELLDALPSDVLQNLLNGALQAALGDPVVAVRSSACRMIGDLVNADFCLADKGLFDLVVATLASCQGSRTISVRISSSWSLANVADAIARRSDVLPYIPKDAISLCPLAFAAIAASNDHEKVRANGIRALGHLLREAQFADAEESTAWLGDAIGCLQSCLQEGTAKVKWNACYATGSLASNPSLLSVMRSNGALPVLIELLAHLINENPNFKVQLQAASALENIRERDFFKNAFFPTISAVARRLHILQDGSQDPIPEENTDTELIQPIVDASFPNFKYHESLKKQLEITLMHLLCLIDAPFSTTCVFPRPDALYAWLKKKVEEATTAEAAGCTEWTEERGKLKSVLQNLMTYESALGNWTELKATLDS